MSRTHSVGTTTPEFDDVTYLFAQDALAAALRYLFAVDGDRHTEALRAVTAVDVAWEVAPASDRRRSTLHQYNIDETLAMPAERWLPRTRELGVVGARLTDDGRPSIIARLLAKDLLPYLFQPIVTTPAYMSNETLLG